MTRQSTFALASLHSRVAFCYISQAVQSQAQGQLRNCVITISARVVNRHAAVFARLSVHVVDANKGYRNHLQFLVGLDDCAGQRMVGDHQNFSVVCALDQLVHIRGHRVVSSEFVALVYEFSRKTGQHVLGHAQGLH